MIFVNSMSDLFHDSVPDEYIVPVALVMMRACQHTFQVLTKRAERMSGLLRGKLAFAARAPHVAAALLRGAAEAEGRFQVLE